MNHIPWKCLDKMIGLLYFQELFINNILSKFLYIFIVICWKKVDVLHSLFARNFIKPILNALFIGLHRCSFVWCIPTLRMEVPEAIREKWHVLYTV